MVKVLTVIAGCLFGCAAPFLLLRSARRTEFLLGGYLAALVFLPFAFDTSTTLFFERYWYLKGITRGLDITVADFLLIGLVIDRLLDPRQEPLKAPPGTAAFALLIGAMAVSLIDAHEPALGFFELLKFVKGFALFWVLANICRSRYGFTLVTNYLAVTLAGLVAFIFWYWLRGDWHHMRMGNSPHKNVWALFVNTLAPAGIALGFFRFQRWIYRLGFLLLVAGLGVIFKMSDSRGGQLCFVISVALTCALALWYLPRGRFSFLQMALLAAALGGGLAFFYEDLHRRWLSGVDTRSYVTPGGSHRLGDRDLQNEYCLQVIKEFPINGVGLSNYPSYYWNFYAISLTLTHNIYLLTAAETGFIGLAALLYFFAYWPWLAVTNLRRTHPPPLLAVAIGLPAAFLATVVHCWIEYNFRNTICLMAYCLMAGVASGYRSGTRTATD